MLARPGGGGVATLPMNRALILLSFMESYSVMKFALSVTCVVWWRRTVNTLPSEWPPCMRSQGGAQVRLVEHPGTPNPRNVPFAAVNGLYKKGQRPVQAPRTPS